MNIEDVHGVRVMLLDADGPAIAGAAETGDLLGNAWFDHIGVIVVPVQRLAPEFFRLRTGMAGEIAQKAVNFRVTLAVVGDLGGVEQSDALRDFMAESNRGEHVWFYDDVDALRDRLSSRASRG
jgi:hypothetical protein